MKNLFFVILTITLLASCTAPSELPEPTEPPARNEATPTAKHETAKPAKALSTPTSIEVTVTEQPTVAVRPALPVSEEYGFGIYATSLGLDGFWYIFESGLSSYPTTSLLKNSPDEKNKFRAIYLEFAHFADRVAFWTEKTATDNGALWVSDLGLKAPQKVFEDKDLQIVDYEGGPYLNGYGDIRLQWSPDDIYLIVESQKDVNLSSIYDARSGSFEAYKYVCDRIALSPKTGKIALWCPSSGKDEYSVIEWGGEIWKQATGPSKIVAKRSMDGYDTWSFSSDGSQVAYYDFSDPEENIVIADLQGKVIRKILPNSSKWVMDDQHTAFSIAPPSPPLHWSENGSRLIVWGVSIPDHPCPPLYSEGNIFEQVPCWQVIDVSDGTIVWTVADSITELLPEQIDPKETWPYDFKNPIISPDGRYLVIYAFVGIREWSIFDLSNNNQEIYGGNYYPDTARWGPVP